MTRRKFFSHTFLRCLAIPSVSEVGHRSGNDGRMFLLVRIDLLSFSLTEFHFVSFSSVPPLHLLTLLLFSLW